MTKEELYEYFYIRDLHFTDMQHHLSKFVLDFTPDAEEYRVYYRDRSLKDYSYWSELLVKESMSEHC